MAIVTISQIKHRRGVKGVDPMPQLASAEFGWAIDAQELYIGNGTITEGAPVTGNTQILTEHSDLSVLLSDYTYTGPFPGATMQTGPAPASPVVRANDAHDDDRVNVRDFGAVGDGITDDTAAIQRAIDQHALNLVSNRYWTTVYVPAGTYVTNAALKLPSHTRLVGDGFVSSVITLAAGNDVNVIEMERVSGADPTDIYVAGMGFTTLSSATGKPVCAITNASDVTFDRCAFTGANADTTITPTLAAHFKACILFNPDNTATLESSNIKFNQCLFTGATYGIATSTEAAGDERRQDIHNVIVDRCVFTDLYKGIVLGFETGTNPSADPFPSEWRITNSFFDVITAHGIHGFKANKCTSAMNHFGDVGNLQTATVTHPNITLGDTGGENPVDTIVTLADYANNYSIGDQFDRTDADDATAKRVESFCNNSYIIDPSDIRYGSLHVEPGRLIELTDATVVAATTGIAFDTSLYYGAVIDYQVDRGPTRRKTGSITFVLGDAVIDQAMTEEFTETTLSTEVVFTLDTAIGTATLFFTAQDQANHAVLSYSIRHLTCVPAAPTTGV